LALNITGAVLLKSCNYCRTQLPEAVRKIRDLRAQAQPGQMAGGWLVWWDGEPSRRHPVCSWDGWCCRVARRAAPEACRAPLPRRVVTSP